MTNQLLLEKYIIQVLKEQEDRSDIGEYPLAPDSQDDTTLPHRDAGEFKLPKNLPHNKEIDPGEVKPTGLITKTVISAALSAGAFLFGWQLNAASDLESKEGNPNVISAPVKAKIIKIITGGNRSDDLSNEIESQADSLETNNNYSYEYNSNDINEEDVFNLIESEESFVAAPYYDPLGNVTIGYGVKIEGLPKKQNPTGDNSGQNIDYLTNTPDNDPSTTTITQAMQTLSAQASELGVDINPNATSISEEKATELYKAKFYNIYSILKGRVGSNFQYLPREIKEVLADMAYNMGPYHTFFKTTKFIKSVKRLAQLLAKDNLTLEESDEVKELVTVAIPKHFSNSTYFDVGTSHDKYPDAPGRPNISSFDAFKKIVEPLSIPTNPNYDSTKPDAKMPSVYDENDRPMKLLKKLYELAKSIFSQNSNTNESYSLKSVYNNLFS